METVEEYKNIRIINDEPEFCACDSTCVSADFFILCEENKQLFGRNIFDLEVCGMSLLNWVVRACGKQPKILKVDSNSDPISVVRPYIDDGVEYSVVFYADTPLLNKTHVSDLLGFIDRKRMNVCKFKRGLVFKNEYIKDNDEIFSIDEYDFASNDFYVVSSYEDFAFVKKHLTSKVIDYHKRNGVYFENELNSNVDANTDIGYFSEISSGASVVDGSKVAENCKLAKNVTISGSAVGKNAVIGEGTIIKNSIIKEGAHIGEGVIIINSVIGKNISIETGAKIVSSSLRDGVVVKNFAVIDDGRIGENSVIQKHAKILGLTEKTIVGAGSDIGACSLVCDSVLSADSVIDNNSEIKGKVK